MILNQKHLLELGEEWLAFKVERMKNLLEIATPNEGLYREILLSLGYPKNKLQFLELALILPYREIKKLRNKFTIEQALLYRAGFTKEREGLPEDFDFSLKMEKGFWVWKGMRPANYPERRILGISLLLVQTIELGLVEFFLKQISEEIPQDQSQEITPNQAQKTVKKIMNFSGIGIQRKLEMFFNIILPFMLAYERGNSNLTSFLREIFFVHPPLSENSTTKSFKNLLPKDIKYLEINISTQTYFGIHFFKSKNS